MGYQIKRDRKRNSDVRCGCSHNYITVKDVVYEEQEKTWMVAWGSFPRKGQWELGLVLSSLDRIGGSYKRKNRAGKGKSCRGERGFILLLNFTIKLARLNFVCSLLTIFYIRLMVKFHLFFLQNLLLFSWFLNEKPRPPS